MNTYVDTLPIFVIGALLFIGLCGAAELGGIRRRQREPSGETVYAASAAVSLLALLISFTFSVALNRYDNRRDLVVEEAAAIGMTWQRAKLFHQPTRSRVEAVLSNYIDRRLVYFDENRLTDRTRAADSVGRQLRLQLWAVADELNAGNVQPLINRALIDSLTRMDDAAARRESLAREHIPLLVIDLLIVFSVIAALSLGYSSALHGSAARGANIAFFVLVALAIMLVLDLDRPRTGLVTVSQLPMLELETLIDAHAPPGSPSHALKQPGHETGERGSTKRTK